MENFSFTLNLWDVGGQKSLRSYWRNYFECTDGLIWVVDSADKRRLEDCKAELHTLLQEEVNSDVDYCSWNHFFLLEVGRRNTVNLCKQTRLARSLHS